MDLDEGKINNALDSNGISLEEEVTVINGGLPGENGSDGRAAVTTEEIVKEENTLNLLYKIDDHPGWHTSVVLGIQHCLLAIGGTIGMPLILAPHMCMGDTDLGYLGISLVLNSIFFISGIFTFLQTTFGSRLPILQGGSFAFLPPAFAILALPHNQCPAGPVNINGTNGTLLYNDTDGSLVDGTELWQRRMREVQGAIAVASVVEVILAFTGCMGFLMRFIGPLTMTPIISLTGLSLLNSASSNASGQWGIAFFTMGSLIIFSQYLSHVKLPFPYYTRKKGCHIRKSNFFQLFSALITMILAWLLCFILTETGVFPDDPNQSGYRGRTDLRTSVLYNSPWFHFPYPGQWGLPIVTGAGVVGMIIAVLTGTIGSIADYYACARISGAPPLPKHALNRGLLFEGLGCIVAGLVGTGTGLAEYSENISAIGITRVGSRRVIQAAGIMLFFLGMFGKFGAVFVLIPDPIIGGLFCVIFGLLTGVGLSTLQHIDLNSSRNLFILGFSFFMGLMVPIWLGENPDAINTGLPELDQVFSVVLKTPVIVGGVLGAFLDNTIPGTVEERGMKSFKSESFGENDPVEKKEKYETRIAKCYNLPFSTDWRFSRYFPILPEFGKTRKEKKNNVIISTNL